MYQTVFHMLRLHVTRTLLDVNVDQMSFRGFMEESRNMHSRC